MLDELREDVHRELMRCHMAIHPRHEAVQLHQQIVDAAAGMAAAPSVLAVLPTQGAPGLYHPPAWAGAGLHDATQCLQQARRHLAQADAQLQLSLFPRA